MQSGQPDLFDLYFAYTKKTEAAPFLHRWAMLTALSAFLGRQIWFPFGDSRIFPNIYAMFVGDPGSRKSTAIKKASKLIRKAGYMSFAAQRTTKEKFLEDLERGKEEDIGIVPGRKKSAREIVDDIEIMPIKDETPREVFINADEFNDFMGPGNLEFQSILGSLWDWDDPELPWELRIKNGKSLEIFQPTISILGGNTPTNFAQCFPPAAIGQGFMSRLILIFAESTGVKITFPEEPPVQLKENLLRKLLEIKRELHGEMQILFDAREALDMIYKTWPEIEDQRFKHYSTRRFTHLLKLCILQAAGRCSQEITQLDVIRANTVLAYAENLMPKALGELGKARTSEAANKIMQALYAARAPLTMQDLWKIARMDLDKPADLSQVIGNLQMADQIHHVTTMEGTGKGGYLPKAKMLNKKVVYVNYDYLKGKEMPP